MLVALGFYVERLRERLGDLEDAVAAFEKRFGDPEADDDDEY